MMDFASPVTQVDAAGPDWVRESIRTEWRLTVVLLVAEVSVRREAGEFLVTGSVPDGVLVTGMWARLKGTDEFGAEVAEIERFPVDRSGRDTRLTFCPSDASELEAWTRMDWSSATLELTI